MFDEIDKILDIRKTYRRTYDKYVELIKPKQLEDLRYIMNTGWQLLH